MSIRLYTWHARCHVRLEENSTSARRFYFSHILTPLGHDKRISFSGFHRFVHSFKRFREKACRDCKVTWRYKRIERRFLTFNIFSLPFLRCENRLRERGAMGAILGGKPHLLNSILISRVPGIVNIRSNRMEITRAGSALIGIANRFYCKDFTYSLCLCFISHQAFFIIS